VPAFGSPSRLCLTSNECDKSHGCGFSEEFLGVKLSMGHTEERPLASYRLGQESVRICSSSIVVVVVIVAGLERNGCGSSSSPW